MAKKKTFAQRAKAIIKKYKRADFDEIEKGERDAELDALAQEQEAVRQASGIAQQEQQFANGGMMNSYPDGGFIAGQAYDVFGNVIDAQNQLASATGQPQPTQYGPAGASPAIPQPQSINQPIANQAPQLPTTLQGVQPGAPIGAEQDTPYRGNVSPVGLISSVAGNLPGLFTKAKDVKLGRLTPEKVDLTKERQGIEQRANVSAAIARRNARTAGSAGQYLSNVGAVETSLQRETGQQLGRSFQAEETANARERARTAAANAAIEEREIDINARERGAAKTAKTRALQGITKGITGFARDKSRTTSAYDALNLLSPNYGLVNVENDRQGIDKILKRKYRPGVKVRNVNR